MSKLNFLKIYTFLTILAISITSCEDTEKTINITRDNLIDKWQYIWQQGYEQEGGIYQDLNLDVSNKEWYLILKEDGTMENINENEGFDFTGEWDILNKNLTLYYPSYSVEYTIAELKENTLVIEYNYENEDEIQYIKYTLKRR